MAKKKPTAKQLAARKKFVAAVKSGKFLKKKAKKKPAKKKAAKKLTKTKLMKQMKAKGLKLPHGYQITKRKKK